MCTRSKANSKESRQVKPYAEVVSSRHAGLRVGRQGPEVERSGADTGGPSMTRLKGGSKGPGQKRLRDNEVSSGFAVSGAVGELPGRPKDRGSSSTPVSAKSTANIGGPGLTLAKAGRMDPARAGSLGDTSSSDCMKSKTSTQKPQRIISEASMTKPGYDILRKDVLDSNLA